MCILVSLFSCVKIPKINELSNSAFLCSDWGFGSIESRMSAEADGYADGYSASASSDGVDVDVWFRVRMMESLL